MDELLKKFFADITHEGVFPIYNEASLQHELGFYLRKTLNGTGDACGCPRSAFRVDFERNVENSPFTDSGKIGDIDVGGFVKKETDLFIYDPADAAREKRCAIELKYPRNAAYPDVYRWFTKDIKFMEQVSKAYGITTYCVAVASWKAYYEYREPGEGANKDLYRYFRTHGSPEVCQATDSVYSGVAPHREWSGINRCPKSDIGYSLDNDYVIRWNQAVDSDGNGIKQTDRYRHDKDCDVFFYVIEIKPQSDAQTDMTMLDAVSDR